MNQQKESPDRRTVEAKTNIGGIMVKNPEKVNKIESENEPRPTPWTYRTAKRDGKHVPPLMEIIDRGGVYVLSVVDKANAANIVKAINSHEKLVEMLRVLSDFLNSEPSGNEWTAERKLLKQVNQALADATEK